MQSTQISEFRPGMPAAQPSGLEAGRQRQGRLWSNLKEVCELLHICALPCADWVRFTHSYSQV